jgi:transposase
MRSVGTAKELEARRRLAVQRVNEGWKQKDVAAFLGVHPVTVSDWVRRHRERGDDGLSPAPTPGRPRKLTPRQEAAVLGWLTKLPSEFGFPTELWTARRVADLIRRRFGVSFHPGYLREWLAARGHSPQKPARRARQRRPEEVARWLREDWPRIQKKSRPSMRTSC